MNTIKVLHMLEGLHCGGIETFVYSVFENNIVNGKFDFVFLVENKENNVYDSKIRKNGGKIFYYLNIKYKPLAHIINLFYYFIKIRPNIIHIHLGFFSGIVAFFAFICGIKKIIISSHFSQDLKELSVFRHIYRYFCYILIKVFATEKVACSDSAGKFLFKKDYTILSNGIDTEKFKFNQQIRNKIRKELNIDDKFVVGHVGRFSYEKNHKFLIEIFSEIYKQNKNSVLLLIGDGPLKKEVEQKVSELNLSDNVLFMGIKSNVCDYYQAMDTFVLPSLHEGLPFAILEAQCSGLPCFISDGISNESILCNTIKIQLSKSTKEWIEKILEETKNFKRIDCSEFVKKIGFDIKNIARKIEQIYLEM
jgi:glycosyltransferase involved in cell wall biosynthesis